MTALDYAKLADASAQSSGFRVPRFELLIEGSRPDPRTLRDVVDVTYRDSVDQIDAFELTVANWDPARRRHPYIGSEGVGPADADTRELETLFEPCSKRVELRLGYGDDMVRMLRGNFTTMEPTFSSSGPHTLAVRGLNEMHRMRRKKYDENFHDRTDSQIARSYDGKTDPEWRNSGQDARRIPMPVRVDPEAAASESPVLFVGQKSEYDIDFLWRRARIRGYVVEVRDDIDGSPFLYFGPSTRGPSPYELWWGAGLIDVKATLTTANQVKKVTVRGFDRAAQRPIEESADWDDPQIRRLNPPALSEIVRQCDPREERVVTRPVATRAEARDLARAILRGHAQELVKVQASVVGLPHLRAGSRVKIGGIGARLSGEYFVVESTHTLNAGGYVTKFTARREDPDSGKRIAEPAA
jgi:Bacteriophage probable baseplate hub protein